ncbi:hypothetical protein AN641_08340 [Candidatus Epulonipiscioides gigas]|nr:hypothetical protein AN641_08340 [Epulopiscium sp. SCG-C07WGA-EpuloA2]
MIPLTKIDKDLNIYKNNKIILFGVGCEATKLINLFKYFEIEVFAIYNYANQEIIRGIDNNLLIDEIQLKKLVSKENIIVQFALSDKEKKAISFINNLNISKFIYFAEAYEILIYLKKVNLIKVTNYFASVSEYMIGNIYIYKHMLYNYLLANASNQPIIICMPSKTGDFTLVNTFKKNNINYFFPNLHCPEIFNKQLYSKIFNKIKFVMGVREPISQIISSFYQNISRIGSDNLFSIFKSENLQDVQKTFDEFVEILNLDEWFSKLYISKFISLYCANIADIMKEPFDKEKGYKVIQDGNVEVFVYQLEKLNDNVQALSDWVGVPFDTLVNGNVAANKWIADSYKQAQKEIKISQEFFDKYFNEPYVKHFYSDEDIEKFKERWRPHIR